MKDNAVVYLPDGTLAVRVFIYIFDALYLLGDGRLVRLGRDFPPAAGVRII